MKKRDKPFKLSCNKSDPKEIKHSNFKKAQNYVMSKIEESRKQYYQNYFQKYCTNVKKTWDGTESICGKNSNNF